MASLTPITDLPRNDVEAALAYVRERQGRVDPDEYGMLFMLQDDSAELLERVRAEFPPPTEPAPIR